MVGGGGKIDERWWVGVIVVGSGGIGGIGGLWVVVVVGLTDLQWWHFESLINVKLLSPVLA